MARRRRRSVHGDTSAFRAVPLVTDHEVSDHITINGRHVTPGTELKVRGQGSARFRFRQHVRRPDGTEWVDVIGDTGFRAFRPSAVRTVHRLNKTRANAA